MTLHLKDVVVTPGRWEGALNQKKAWGPWEARDVSVHYRALNENRTELWYNNGSHAIFSKPIPFEHVPGLSMAFTPEGMLSPSSFRSPRLWWDTSPSEFGHFLEYSPFVEPAQEPGVFVPVDSLRMVDAYLGTDWDFTCVYLQRTDTSVLMVVGVKILRKGREYLAGLVSGANQRKDLVPVEDTVDFRRPRWKPPRFVSPLPVEFIRDVHTPKRVTKKALREIDAYIANGLLLGDDE